MPTDEPSVEVSVSRSGFLRGVVGSPTSSVENYRVNPAAEFGAIEWETLTVVRSAGCHDQLRYRLVYARLV